MILSFFLVRSIFSLLGMSLGQWARWTDRCQEERMEQKCEVGSGERSGVRGCNKHLYVLLALLLHSSLDAK